jgi:hypothetical protein
MNDIAQNAAFLFGGFFALIMLLCGAGVIAVGLFALQRHRAAGDWPQVPAQVETSEVLAERRFSERDETTPTIMYRPLIRYRYSAPGGSYCSDKLAVTGRLHGQKSAAQRVADRYPAGTTVMARYNPADPSEAILERDGAGGIFFVFFGLLCWIIPVLAARQIGLSWTLIGAVLALLVALPLLAMLASRSSLAVARSRGLCPPAGSCSDADVATLASRGEKHLAIRLYRELHGGGLKEARLAVEALLRERQPPLG